MFGNLCLAFSFPPLSCGEHRLWLLSSPLSSLLISVIESLHTFQSTLPAVSGFLLPSFDLFLPSPLLLLAGVLSFGGALAFGLCFCGIWHFLSNN